MKTLVDLAAPAALDAAYTVQVAEAVAAAATLAFLLLAAYLIARAIFRLLRLVTVLAGHLTLVTMLVILVIGWLNR